MKLSVTLFSNYFPLFLFLCPIKFQLCISILTLENAITVSNNITQHNDIQHNNRLSATQSIMPHNIKALDTVFFLLNVINAECYLCCVADTPLTLSVIMLNVVVLIVVILNAVVSSKGLF